MARIVNPAGVPANPVIEGNVTATSGESNPVDYIPAHKIGATAVTPVGYDPEVSGDPWWEGVASEVRVSGDVIETISRLVPLSNDDGYGTSYATISTAASDDPIGLSRSAGASIQASSEGGGAAISVDAASNDPNYGVSGEGHVAMYASHGIRIGAPFYTLELEANRKDIKMYGNVYVNDTPVSPAKDSRYQQELFDDFAYSATSLIVSSNLTGNAALSNPSTGQYGVQQLSTGTGTTNRCAIGVFPAGAINVGSYSYFETAIRIPTLSDETDKFTVAIGLGPQNNIGNGMDFGAGSAAFIYEANSQNHSPSAQTYWQVRRGTSNYNNALVEVPVTTDYFRLKIAWTNQTYPEFWINDVLVSASTADLLTLPAQAYYVIEKKSGTNSRTLQIDYSRAVLNFWGPAGHSYRYPTL